MREATAMEKEALRDKLETQYLRHVKIYEISR